jgi:DNA-binding beta-propeller fold protein YncE
MRCGFSQPFTRAKPAYNHRDFDVKKKLPSEAVLPTDMPRHKKTIPALLVFAVWMFHVSLALAEPRYHDAQPATFANRIAGGDMPLNLLEVEGRWVVSTNSGWHNAYLQIYDEQLRKVSGRVDLPSAWYGLAYDAKRKFVLASSPDSAVYVIPFDEGNFGSKREIALDPCRLPAGLALGVDGTAWVACNQNDTLMQIDYVKGKVLRSARVGSFPYAIIKLPLGKLAISLWGQSAVAIIDGATLEQVALISVGSHPTDMLYLPQAKHLLVACSDSDDLSVIDVAKQAEARRFHLDVPDVPVGGAQPVALAADAASGNIYVALAAVNSVAVFQIKSGRQIEYSFRSLFGVGAYPTALFFSGPSRTLFIANGRNLVTGSNAPPDATATRYPKIGTIIGGAIEAYSAAQLRNEVRTTTLRHQVYDAAPAEPAVAKERIAYFSATSSKPGPIQYVFYILKENRTYDQVLGDIPEADGDPRLVLFGEANTPNHHALARDFILYDNFFVDGDVSADGHFWSMAATATDYVARLWTTTYSGHAEAAFDAPYDGDEEHDHPIAAPGSGFLWDRAKKLGITYRDYGEWGIHDTKDKSKDVVYLAGLKNHFDPYYRDEIGDVTDQERVDEWQKEFRAFEADGNLPQLSIIHLPNDHTCGTRPGYPTPRAMVADNDLALGRIVETISHSRFWPHSVIFVMEDDAQDGPDHVDAHRSVLLSISPFTRRHMIEHRHFQTASALKTMEQILGMGSLTFFDDRAPSLLVDFDPQPALDPYTVLQPSLSLTEMNTPDAPGAKESSRWDLTHPDRAPEAELNRVIWQSVRGADSLPPAPVVQVRMQLRSDD